MAMAIKNGSPNVRTISAPKSGGPSMTAAGPGVMQSRVTPKNNYCSPASAKSAPVRKGG